MKLACSASDNPFFSIILFPCNDCIILHPTGLDKIILYLFLRTKRKVYIPCMPHVAPVWGGVCMHAWSFLQGGWLGHTQTPMMHFSLKWLWGWTLLNERWRWMRYSSNSTHNLKTQDNELKSVNICSLDTFAQKSLQMFYYVCDFVHISHLHIEDVLFKGTCLKQIRGRATGGGRKISDATGPEYEDVAFVH